MQPDFKLREILLPLLPKHWDYSCVQMCTNLGGIFFPWRFQYIAYSLAHSVPYKENMILSCVQISIVLDPLEDSVSLILIVWSLPLIHIVRNQGSVGFVSFSLVLVALFCSFWCWPTLVFSEIPGYVIWSRKSIWGNSHSPRWNISPVPCFPLLLAPPYTHVTLLCLHSSWSSDLQSPSHFFSLLLGSGSRRFHILSLRTALLSIEAAQKPKKDILPFVALMLVFLYHSFMEFPSLCLHCLSVIACLLFC